MPKKPTKAKSETKKTTRKHTSKKSLTEATKYAVSVDDDAPSVLTTTKIVDASNPADAVRKATSGSPMNSNAKVSVTKAKTNQTITTPAITPSQSPETPVVEGSFPYALMLPVSFQPLLETVIADTDAHMRIHNGQVYMKITNQKDFALVQERLAKSEDRLAKVILEGIRSSR